METVAGAIMLMSGWRRALSAIMAGAFAVLALAPFGFFAAMFVSFPVLVFLLDGASGNPHRHFLLRLWPAFQVGWLFGFGYLTAGLWWLGNALLVQADEFAFALPLAVFGLPAFLALFFGFAGAIARALWQDGFGRIAALAFALGLTEWLRGFLFTGFPWNEIGQGLMPSPLMMQSIKLVSSGGMSVIAVLIFASPALIATKKGMGTGLSVALVLLVGHLGFGAWQLQAKNTPEPTDRIIRLVQPMIDQSRKIDNQDRAAIFEEHLALTKAAPRQGGRRPDYVVWPETSIPFILMKSPDALTRIAEVLEDGQVLIAGAVRVEEASQNLAPRYYNSIYMLDGSGRVLGTYDKVHLVPLGEYLPFEDFFNQIGLRAIAAMPGGYSAAARHRVLSAPDGLIFYPLICYEIIFGRAIDPAADNASAIVNITNDGWFGITPGPWQHFHQARLRAVETGLPVIRNSNSGISAIISSDGKYAYGLDYGVHGYLDLTLPGKFVPIWTARQRDINFWLLMLLALIVALHSRGSFIFFRN